MRSHKDPSEWGIAPKMSLSRFFVQTMTGAEIRAALQGNSISNENEVQYFNPDGTVLYQKGSKRASGHWDVEGDKFCSDLSIHVRPPLEAEPNPTAWQCHPVVSGKKHIAFIIDRHAYSWRISKGKKID